MCKSVVSVSHSGKLGIHTGVPASVTDNTVTRVKIFYVVALTGGANEGAGSAAKAGCGKLIPSGIVEKLLSLAAAKGIGGKILKRKLIHNLFDLILLCINCHSVALLKKSAERIKKCTSTLGVSLKVERIALAPAGNVTRGGCSIDAEGGAEAGLGRLGASERNDDSLLALHSIEAVAGLGEEYAIKDIEALYVAVPNAEYDEIADLFSYVDDLDILALGLEPHKVLGLGEEEILRALIGVKSL